MVSRKKLLAAGEAYINNLLILMDKKQAPQDVVPCKKTHALHMGPHNRKISEKILSPCYIRENRRWSKVGYRETPPASSGGRWGKKKGGGA